MRERVQGRPSVVRTWLLAIVWPTAAARRAEGIGWVGAWLMFAVAAALGAATAAWVVASLAEGGPLRGLAAVERGLSEFGRELSDGGYDTPFAWATLVCLPIAVMASAFVQAYALMPLAAGDELAGDSFRRMLKRLLVASPWLIGAALLIGLVGWVAWLAGVGWIDRWDLSGWIGVWSWAAALTIGWAVPASIALAGRGARAVCRWPPRCESCGYSLMAMSGDQACPECGRSRLESVGEDVRPGVRANGLGSAIVSILVAIGLPWRFGRELRVSGGGGGGMWWGLGASVLLCVVLTPVCALISIGVFFLAVPGMGTGSTFWPDARDAAWFAMACSIAAAGLVSTIVSFSLVGSAVVGTCVSWASGRNLLSAAAQAACFASPVLILAPLLMWMSWLVAVPVFAALDGSPNPGPTITLAGTLLAMWNTGAPAAVAIYFLVAVGIATRAARFANR
ncbi:MAG: hypothetical protein AAGB29_04195 [Planctomycetota bacterium]